LCGPKPRKEGGRPRFWERSGRRKFDFSSGLREEQFLELRVGSGAGLAFVTIQEKKKEGIAGLRGGDKERHAQLGGGEERLGRKAAFDQGRRISFVEEACRRTGGHANRKFREKKSSV